MSPRPTNLWVRTIFRQLALGVVTILIMLPFLEVTVRLRKPPDPDFYNSEKFLRLDPPPGEPQALIPNSAGSYTGVPVRVNSIGMRDREVEVPKPSGVIRILAIGDSVTFGFGVRLEESYPKRLEALLNARPNRSRTRVEVLNAGIPGTGLVSFLQHLEAKTPALQPDLILIGLDLKIMDYDAVSAASPRRKSSITIKLRELNRVMLRHSRLYLLSYLHLKSILIRTRIFDINTAYDQDFLALQAPSERQERAWASSLSVLDRIVRAAQGRRVPIVLIVFPMAVQLDKQTLDLYRQTLRLRVDSSVLDGIPQRRFAAFARARNVPLIDLLPRFRESGSEALFLENHSISHDWIHPSARGHELAAKEVATAILTLKLVPLQ